MSKYKIATKTDLLRIKVAKEVFGEIEDCDGIRDIPSWEIFEKCLEQHKQILQQAHELAVMKKALELACDYLVSNGDDELYYSIINIYDDDEYLTAKINYFTTKAKEMLKDE